MRKTKIIKKSLKKMDELESREYYAILLEKLMKKKDMSFSDYAEMWYYEHNGIIPDRSSQLWKDMYRAWLSFSFDPGKKV
jgi:hypothetical protein